MSRDSCQGNKFRDKSGIFLADAVVNKEVKSPEGETRLSLYLSGLFLFVK